MLLLSVRIAVYKYCESGNIRKFKVFIHDKMLNVNKNLLIIDESKFKFNSYNFIQLN